MMRPGRVLGAVAALVASATAHPAHADWLTALVWESTTGSGTPGGSVIEAQPGDVLRLRIDLTASSPTALNTASLALRWDAGDLSGQNPEECPAPPNVLPGLCFDGTNSWSPIIPGVDLSIDGSTAKAQSFDAHNPASPTASSVLYLGAIEFVVEQGAAFETVEIFYGLVDGIFTGTTTSFPVATATVTPPLGLVLTDTTNITLAASQVESGDDMSENPDVTGGNGGALVLYTETTGSYTTPGPYGPLNLGDGDVGITETSDGYYAIPDDGSIVLDFGSVRTVGSIAIYNGYTNRDDGIYTLRDAASNVLGAWTIYTPTGFTNDGANSFWLQFDTPVTTSSLTLEFTTADCCNTASFREIQVFTAPVSVPAMGARGHALTVGVLLLVAVSMLRRQRTEAA